MATNASGTPDVTEVLASHIEEKLGEMQAADDQALDTMQANSAKIQDKINDAMASALMGPRRKRGAPVQFPDPVFHLALALTNDEELAELRDMAIALAAQKRLIPPMLAFFRRLQGRINQAVESVLEELGNVDQGTSDDT